MITVVGSSNTDFVLRASRFPFPGETILADALNIVPGGKGANQAVAAAKLGSRAALVARVGSDAFGRAALRSFNKLKIDTEYVVVDKSCSSGLAFIVVRRDGANTIVVAPNANARLSREDIRRAARIMKRSRLLLLQLEIPRETARYAIESAYRYGVKVLLNPAPIRYNLGRDILRKVWAVIPNEAEAEALTGVKVASIGGAHRAANKLLEMGPAYAIITLGSRGAVIASRKEFFHMKLLEVKAVDTTAAGDAFCGALASALDEDKSVKEAAEFANFAAALSVMKLGAQTSLPTRKEVEEFLGRTKRARHI